MTPMIRTALVHTSRNYTVTRLRYGLFSRMAINNTSECACQILGALSACQLYSSATRI